MSNVDLGWSRVRAARGFRAALEAAASQLEAAIDRSPARAFAVLTVFYLGAVVVLSSQKLLWLDELITVHIARLGTFGAIWHALAQGADPNPPITHLLVHYSRLMFGDHELAYRLPALLGYWTGMVSLFAFLQRRVPATWALAGTVLSMAMAAFDYSFESRSYAIFYGLAMVAVRCWSVAVDGEVRPAGRKVSLAGMVLALAAGISTNYFAVLALLPIAFGEAARTIWKWRASWVGANDASSVSDLRDKKMSRRWGTASLAGAIDFRVWVGLAVAGSTLLVYRSLIARAIAQFAPYAWNKVSIDQVFDCYTEMVEIVLYPILALFVFALILYFVRRQLAPACGDCRGALSRRWAGSVLFAPAGEFPVPAHEAVAIFALMAYPILGYIVASIRGGMLSPRFVIPVCFGFAIAATLVAYRLFRSLPRAGAVMLCFCAAWFIARESVVGIMYAQQKQAFFNLVNALPRAEAEVAEGAPIVIPDPLLVLTFQRYAPAALASRVVFPVDFPAIRTFRHDDSPDENLWAGRDFVNGLPILPLATFQREAGEYLIVAKDGNWLIEDLRAHLYPVRRLAIDAEAGDIGGFTPLAHGKPAFYVGVGDAAFNGRSPRDMVRAPFHAVDNLPASKALVPGQTTQETAKE